MSIRLIFKILQFKINGKFVACGRSEIIKNNSEITLFIFAGQSNMMGANDLEPKNNVFTDQSLEYKYVPKLRGQIVGDFVVAQNLAGEWHYKDFELAYGDRLTDLSYKSTLDNYTLNTYFCPAMSNGKISFADQSEANTCVGASLAPYFVTECAQKYGISSVYAHMAKGSVKIDYYFTEEMKAEYNCRISSYNATNGTTHEKLTSISGAGEAFDNKYASLLKDYTNFAPNKLVKNKCFIWLQGESDADNSYIEYKLKMQVLWTHLQKLGITHFFVLRVGYWGSPTIINVIKAQEDFCNENNNCYLITRAPSLIPHPSATTENWWINQPSAEYDNCRDSYVTGSNNHHFNEKAFRLFAKRSAENVYRVLCLGLDPVLEEENIKGMIKDYTL